MASLPEPGLPAERGGDAPIYICMDTDAAERLALDLRHRGFKARTFVSVGVLRNAARTQPPAALILALTTETAVLGRLLSSGTEPAAHPIIFVSERDDTVARLAAARAGGTAFLTEPINDAALFHALRQDNTEAAGPSVLLIDEDPQSPLARKLETTGLTVTHLHRVDATLETLRAGRFGALLVNDRMKAAEPADLILAVRQDPAFYDLPVVVLTAADKRKLDRIASSVGIDAIVGLPVDPQDLAAIVRARARRMRGLRGAYAYLARHDPATGLSNRAYFEDELGRALRSLAQTGHSPALLYLRFDAEPPASTDRDPLLKHIADRLWRELPAASVAARVADDAFAALIYHIDAGELELLGNRIGRKLAELSVENRQGVRTVRCRAGVTTLGRHHSGAAEALARAREAAALQSAAGEQPAPQDVPKESRGYWHERVEEALADNRFRLVYQPIASLSGTPTPFYEVFLRMLSDDGADVSPREFLSAVAEPRLAQRLDRWVVGRAVDVLASQHGLKHKPVLFIKLLPDTVVDREFGAWLGAQLAQADLPGERLVFELTQEVAATRAAEAQEQIETLRRLGCRVALEHFGANGIVREDLLQALRPGFVKIAPSLTDDIGSSRQQQDQVQAIASLARACGAKSVAVSVQDAMHLAVIWRCGIEYLQGYFMQEPADVFAPDAQLAP